MLTADLLSADILKVSMPERLFSVEGHSEILQAELKTCVLRLFLCVGVCVQSSLRGRRERWWQVSSLPSLWCCIWPRPRAHRPPARDSRKAASPNLAAKLTSGYCQVHDLELNSRYQIKQTDLHLEYGKKALLLITGMANESSSCLRVAQHYRTAKIDIVSHLDITVALETAQGQSDGSLYRRLLGDFVFKAWCLHADLPACWCALTDLRPAGSGMSEASYITSLCSSRCGSAFGKYCISPRPSRHSCTCK